MNSQRIENRRTNGSLTVEAALVLPIFIFAILTFIYLLQILIHHNNIQDAITDIGLDVAKYGYVSELIKDNDTDSNRSSASTNQENQKTATNPDNINKPVEGIVSSTLAKAIFRGIDNGFYKLSLLSKIDVEAVNKSAIKNGFNGIHTYFSSYMEENDEVNIVLNYNIKIPLLFIDLDDFQIVQRVKLKAWNGYRPTAKFSKVEQGLEEEKEEMVFITETGSVYHTSSNCTHISLSIRDVPYEHLNIIRNKSGGIYKNCNLCGGNLKYGDTVYVAVSGDKYHSNRSCSGLKRTISEVPISQVSNRRLCSRCGK